MAKQIDLLARPMPPHLVTDELRPLDDVLDELDIYWQERDAEEQRLEAKAGAGWAGWDNAAAPIAAPPAPIAVTAANEDCPF